MREVQTIVPIFEKFPAPDRAELYFFVVVV